MFHAGLLPGALYRVENQELSPDRLRFIRVAAAKARGVYVHGASLAAIWMLQPPQNDPGCLHMEAPLLIYQREWFQAAGSSPPGDALDPKELMAYFSSADGPRAVDPDTRTRIGDSIYRAILQRTRSVGRLPAPLASPTTWGSPYVCCVCPLPPSRRGSAKPTAGTFPERW